MSLSNKLFKLSKKLAKEAVKPSKKSPNKKANKKASNSRYRDYEEEFARKYETKCSDWVDRIYEAASYSCYNPDDNVAEYKKQIKMYEDLKRFCEEKPGGKEFFEFEYGDSLLKELQEEFNSYMAESYEEDKRKYIEAQRPIIELSEKILSILKNAGGVEKQRNVTKLLSDEEKKLKDKAIAYLVEQKKIKRESDGHTVIFTIKK